MYWVESGINHRIERANLDGSVREELVHTPLGTRLVLTLDTTKRQMYWADGGLDHIMSSDMDGKHQQEIYKTNSNPSSMDFYGERLSECFYYSQNPLIRISFIRQIYHPTHYCFVTNLSPLLMTL